MPSVLFLLFLLPQNKLPYLFFFPVLFRACFPLCFFLFLHLFKRLLRLGTYPLILLPPCGFSAVYALDFPVFPPLLRILPVR